MIAVRTQTRRRAGYTLLELLAVMAILIVIGAILAPTFRTMSRDTKGKAAADTVRMIVADARAAAIEEGRTYRVSISSDGLKLRAAPDDLEFAQQIADDDEEGPITVEADLPDKVTAHPTHEEGAQEIVDQGGWVRVATFLPDGTCREDSAVIEIKEPGSATVQVRIRGLTGSAAIIVPLKGSKP